MTTVTNVDDDLDPDELEVLYTWVDGIPLSRTKRNMARDFSDGVLVAEVIHHMFPKLVDVHNYPPANNRQQKLQNWSRLNCKVFTKLRFDLSKEVMEQIVACSPGVVERILSMLKTRLERVQWDTTRAQKGRGGVENDRPEVDQNFTSVGRVSSLRDVHTTGGGSSRGGVTFAPGVKGVGRFAPDDSVPVILLEEKEQELLMKDETIHILQAKVKRLEHFVHLKDIRIEDLQKRVEKARLTAKR